MHVRPIREYYAFRHSQRGDIEPSEISQIFLCMGDNIGNIPHTIREDVGVSKTFSHFIFPDYNGFRGGLRVKG